MIEGVAGVDGVVAGVSTGGALVMIMVTVAVSSVVGGAPLNVQKPGIGI